MASIGLVEYVQFLGANRVTTMAQKLQPFFLGPPSPPYSVRKLIQAAGNLVAARTDVVQKPWAVLLLKWQDRPTEPYPVSFYENLFTTSGGGSMNMTDYYRDASLRKLDVTGSKVFGWLTLNANRSDPHSRSDLRALATLTAMQNNIDLSPYALVVACFNVDTDCFGEQGFTCLDEGTSWPGGNGKCTLSPGITGHEMGHGYGMEHSRIQGSSNDYQDPWDIMSALATYMAPDPTLTQKDSQGRTMFWIGPMLNAANMYGRGWLPESRILTIAGIVDETITLRPLTRPDLPGFLLARIGGYWWVEFRVNEGWDAAIPRPAVLVHVFNDQDNHSYIMKGTNGQQDLVSGDIFQSDERGIPSVFVRPIIIDPAGYKATIQIKSAQ